MEVVKLSKIQREENPPRNAYNCYFALQGNRKRVVVNDLGFKILPHKEDLILDLMGGHISIAFTKGEKAVYLPAFVLIGDLVDHSPENSLVTLFPKGN